MFRFHRLLAVSLVLLGALTPGMAPVAAAKGIRAPAQETGFLNRSVQLRGMTYRFQVYVPEEWRRNDHKQWPVILFLHGRGERGAEGMWQTQIGLPEAVRDHPERWPFVIVMPQCPQNHFWTEAGSMELAMTALERETEEFHGDPNRTYLTGLSLGGYGAWELARLRPHRWAAVAIAAGGIFWSYAPERWRQAGSLPGEYARAVGRTPIWMFHGSDDPVVATRQSELIYEAFKSNGGHIRLWIYQGLRHDCWTRAYNEPELPRWLLEHRLEGQTPVKQGRGAAAEPEPRALAERLVVPLHPPAIRLSQAQIDNLVGEYFEANGVAALTVFWHGDRLYGKDRYGQISELAAESPTELFYAGGSSLTRFLVQRDSEGRVTAMVFHDDRHDERWEKRKGNY